MNYNKLSGFSDEISKVVEEQFAVLNKLNINYFEPRGIDGKNISTLNEEEIAELKEKMNRYGIKASSIGSPVGKIKLEEPFEEHFEMFKHVVHIAKELGAEVIDISIGLYERCQIFFVFNKHICKRFTIHFR